MARGTYIVIEGGDGAGKDTQIELLKQEFAGPGFYYTREPGGTQVGKALRQMLLHESHGALDILTESFLFLADRAQHAREVVLPLLQAGKTVVSNRSWISMVAYQLHGRDRTDLRPLVDMSIAHIFRDCPIDRAIILDVSVEVGMERLRAMGKAPDLMERMSPEARQRIRGAFIDLSGEVPNAVLIDANRAPEAVHADVRAAFQSALVERMRA